MTTARSVAIIQASLTMSLLGVDLLPAQDATVTITENALNAYSAAVGTVSQSVHVRVLADLVNPCDLLPGAGGDPTGTLNCPPPPKIVVADGILTWAVQAPHFTVTAAGIRFQARIQSTFSGGGSSYQAIDAPATIAYDHAAQKIPIVVQSTVPVRVNGTFSRYILATINVGKYYSTSISTPNRTFSFALPDGNKTISGSVLSMQITYATKQVLLKPNFSIQ